MGVPIERGPGAEGSSVSRHRPLSPKHTRLLSLYMLAPQHPASALGQEEYDRLPQVCQAGLVALQGALHLPVHARAVLEAYYAAGYHPQACQAADLAAATRLLNAETPGAEGLRQLLAGDVAASDVGLLGVIAGLVGARDLRPVDRIRLDAALALLRLKGHSANDGQGQATQATQIVIHSATEPKLSTGREGQTQRLDIDL